MQVTQEGAQVELLEDVIQGLHSMVTDNESGGSCGVLDEPAVSMVSCREAHDHQSRLLDSNPWRAHSYHVAPGVCRAVLQRGSRLQHDNGTDCSPGRSGSQG